MKKILPIAIFLVAIYFGGVEIGIIPTHWESHSNSSGQTDQILATAFENQRSNIQVQGVGRVTKILADDEDGSRHQRFIIELASGQTLLVAHNIDLAGRIMSLKVGDHVEFNGEYEWNHKGGVIHWTHRDPQGSHVAGWVKHDGHTYQ